MVTLNIAVIFKFLKLKISQDLSDFFEVVEETSAYEWYLNGCPLSNILNPRLFQEGWKCNKLAVPFCYTSHVKVSEKYSDHICVEIKIPGDLLFHYFE